MKSIRTALTLSALTFTMSLSCVGFAESTTPLRTIPLPLRMYPEERTNREPVLALTRSPLVQDRKISLSDLVAETTAFTTPPVMTAGFSHIVVPFDTKNHGDLDAVHEANAFSLLLQSALRWSAGCHQTIDPLPLYRSDKEFLVMTSRILDRGAIRRVAKDASATCVITGTLTRDDKRYTAVIDVFDARAGSLYKRSYREPLGYFELLARMSGDIARALGHPLSSRVQDHILTSRCQYRRSLIELGSLVYEGDRHSELRVFTGIIERDPGFAEARIWAALRGHRTRGDHAGFARHIQLSIDSYLTPEALDWCLIPTPESIVTPQLTESNRLTLLNLLGSDHPRVLAFDLLRSPPADTNALASLTAVAAAHPADPYLLEFLADAVTAPNNPLVDLNLGAELLWTSLQARPDSPGVNGTYRLTRKLGAAMLALGQVDMAAHVMDSIFSEVRKEGGYRPLLDDVLIYEDVLRQNRRYEDAFNVAILGAELCRSNLPAMRTNFVVQAGFAAALAGDSGKVGDVLSEYRNILAGRERERLMLECYVGLLNGDARAAAYQAAPIEAHTPLTYREETLLLAQADIVAEKQDHRTRLETAMASDPLNREMWVLYDAYDRHEPSTNSVFFYDSLGWLFGSDPWVIHAVADFRDRTDDLKLPPVSSLQWDGTAGLMPSHFAVAASVQALLLKKKGGEAEERLRRCLDLTLTRAEVPELVGSHRRLRIFYEYLLRLVRGNVLFPGT